MRLVALVEHPEHVCCRYRIAAFRPYFHRAGHQLTIVSRPGSVREWFAFSQNARAADAVIIQRRLFSVWELSLIWRAARRLIFDFDDAVFQRDSFAKKLPHSTRRHRRFDAVVRSADTVIAGNDFLAEHASRSQLCVMTIPTCVDACRYSIAKHDGRDCQLVWIGSASTLQALERARLLLEEIGKRVACLRLKLVCDGHLEFRNLQTVRCPWSETTEAAELAAADIGISWLPDDDWSRGKCGLKVLQYMAAGLPVVANPVGVQKEMIRQGETGFLCETVDEWRVAIQRLAADSSLRAQMGRAGRRIVELHYSVQSGAQRWLSVLKSLELRRQSA